MRKRKKVDRIKVDCRVCSGFGIYAGANFYENGNPDECGDCDGRGVKWLSENDRFTTCPGGKFLGSSPGAYIRELSRFHYLEVPSPRGRGGFRGNPGTATAAFGRVRFPTPL